MKAKTQLIILLLSAAVVLISGCGQTIKNLTPSEIPMNPSNIYTISLEVRERDAGIVNGTLKPKVVIGGETHMMKRSPLGENIWDYEYAIPSGRSNAVYYYEIEYDAYYLGVRRTKSITLPNDGLLKFSLINRYVVSLEASRGPVGSRIGLNGRGFRPSDQIFVGGTLANSEYYSPNALGFYVPSIPASRNYDVVLRGARGDMTVGPFRVDPAKLQVLPTTISVRTGSRTTLIFSIPTEAPIGGLPIYITTNIPACVILPDVIIPEGSKSISVPLEGGAAGIGVLNVESDGYASVTVPVEVFK